MCSSGRAMWPRMFLPKLRRNRPTNHSALVCHWSLMAAIVSGATDGSPTEVSRVFDEHRAKKAEKEYREALAQWQGRRDGYAEYLELAQSFSGSGSGDIMLAAGEAVFIKVTGASLVEDRRGSGHYEGGSTGVSIPAGSLGGHSVRYRVGANRGSLRPGRADPYRHRHRDRVPHQQAGDLPGCQADPRGHIRQADRLPACGQ